MSIETFGTRPIAVGFVLLVMMIATYCIAIMITSAAVVRKRERFLIKIFLS